MAWLYLPLSSSIATTQIYNELRHAVLERAHVCGTSTWNSVLASVGAAPMTQPSFLNLAAIVSSISTLVSTGKWYWIDGNDAWRISTAATNSTTKVKNIFELAGVGSAANPPSWRYPIPGDGVAHFRKVNDLRLVLNRLITIARTIGENLQCDSYKLLPDNQDPAGLFADLDQEGWGGVDWQNYLGYAGTNWSSWEELPSDPQYCWGQGLQAFKQYSLESLPPTRAGYEDITGGVYPTTTPSVFNAEASYVCYDEYDPNVPPPIWPDEEDPLVWSSGLSLELQFRGGTSTDPFFSWGATTDQARSWGSLLGTWTVPASYKNPLDNGSGSAMIDTLLTLPQNVDKLILVPSDSLLCVDALTGLIHTAVRDDTWYYGACNMSVGASLAGKVYTTLHFQKMG